MNCCNHNCRQSTALHWRVKDITGQRFGRLTVTAHAGKSSAKRGHLWACRCDCGTAVTVHGSSLRGGNTRSCGCLQRDKARAAGDRTRTHGMTRTTTHNIWSGMLQRCRDPNRKDYPRYGGAGVTVCDRWLSFETFLADMGERPAGRTLDRVDGSKGYEPGNCRWATPTEQNRNTSANRVIEAHGERMPLSAWAERTGINSRTLLARLRRGWSEERAVSTPTDKRFSRES
jgi:hypothetical protein